MEAANWVEVIESTLNSSGSKDALPTDYAQVLLTPIVGRATESQQTVFNIVDSSMVREVFRRAVRGHGFGSEETIKNKLGRTLQENYAVSQGPFLDLARAYWTFKLEIDDLRREAPGSLLLLTLASVEQTIASIFFPMPGPMSIPPSLRKKKQIEILKEYAPEIDAQKFASESPILNSAGGASFGKLMLLCSLTLFVYLLFAR